MYEHVLVQVLKVLATCVVLTHQPCHVTLAGAALPLPSDVITCTYARREPPLGAEVDTMVDPTPASWHYGLCAVHGGAILMPWTPPGTYDIEIDVFTHE